MARDAAALTGEPPEGQLPGACDVTAVLGRNDDTVVALAAVQAYPSGFLFELRLVQRNVSRSRWRRAAAAPAPTVVRVSYADGSAGEAWVPPGPRPAGPSAVLVVPRGVTGGPGGWRQEVWVSPLPPPGPVEVSLPAVDLLPGRVVLPAEELHRAAERSVELWADGGGAEPPFDAALAPPLPPAGAPPDDLDDAAEAVRAAFLHVFDASTGDERFGVVQDGAVLRAAGHEAAQRWPEVAATMRVALGGLVFLDEVRAAVQYQLSWTGAAQFGPQLGYAVREHGVWKVARATYCRLLDLAGVQYPPPPPGG